MARRKNDGGGAVGGLLVVVVLIVVFVVKVMATALFVLGPCALAVLFLKAMGAATPAPRIPSAADFDDEGEAVEMKALYRLSRAAEATMGRLYAAGRENAVALTLKSDETRFDARSRLGRDLNLALDEAESQLAAHARRIRGIRAGVLDRIPDVDAEISGWASNRSMLVSTGWGGALLVAAGSLVYLLGLDFGEFAPKVGRFLLWHPMPDALAGNLFVCVLGCLLVTPLVWLCCRQAYMRRVEDPNVSRWRAFSSRWLDDSNWEPSQGDFEGDASGSGSQGSADRDGRGGGQAWHEVLGIDATATAEQIKAAYRAAMRQYHPDLVASLGQKLRDVAEAETKRLNAAFEEAKRVVRFA